MSDVAQATELPDVGALRPPADQPDLPDVDSLQPPTTTPMRGMKGMPTYPQAVLDRLAKGDAVTPVIQKLAQGVATGFGNSFAAITADDQQKMQDAGWLPVTAAERQTVPGALRFAGQALAASFGAVKAGVLSLFPAAIEGTRQAVTQAAKEAGAEAGAGGQAEQIGQEAAGAVEFLGTDASVNTMLMSHSQYAEATKFGHDAETGAYHDVHIGPVPTPEEVPGQAAAIAAHFGLPDRAAAVVQRAYEEKGVLPAEVFNDAHDPGNGVLGDIAAGHMPMAYGGEPHMLPSMPVVAPEDFAALSKEAGLREQQADLEQKLGQLPAGDPSAVDRLTRLEVVERELTNENLTPQARRALSDRRDQILVDTNPEALQEAAAPIEQRRQLEAQHASVVSQLGEIGKTREGTASDVALSQPPKMQGGPSVPVPEGTRTAEPVAPSEVPTPTSETEAPPTATPAAPIPTAVAAKGGGAGKINIIRGTGEAYVPKLAERLSGDDVAAGLYSDPELPVRQSVDLKAQTEKVAGLINDDPQKVIDAVMGRRAYPANVVPEILLKGAREYAEKTGDYGLLRDLATKSRVANESSAVALRLRAHQELGGGTDPLVALRSVEDARAAALKTRGVDVAAQTAQFVRQEAPALTAAKQALNAKLPPWQAFMQSIKC